MEKLNSPLDALYDFKVNQEFALNKYLLYIEYFWKLEKAPRKDLDHLISLIAPVALNTFCQSDVAELNNFFFFNDQASEINLALIRNTETNEIEGYMTCIITTEYFLPNNYTKENEYFIQQGLGILNKNLRTKGLFDLLSNIYLGSYLSKNIGKNILFFDVSVNPISFKYMSEHGGIFPSYYRHLPILVQDFMFQLMKKYDYQSFSEDKPFLIKDCIPSDLDTDYWKNKYSSLSNEAKYFIDQTQLRSGYGLLSVKFINMLQGNTLGVPAHQFIPNFKLRSLFVKEYSFEKPKL